MRALQHIVDGEAVAAPTLGRVTRAVESWLSEIQALLDSVQLGEAIVARDVPCDPDTFVGAAVFFDPQTARVAPAITAYETDAVTGHYGASRTAQVRGVVQAKPTGTTADVVLAGWTSINLSQAVSGEPEVGPYFLSSTDPGKLVASGDGVSPPVLHYDGERSFVLPRHPDGVNAHTHISIPLVCRPAGSHTATETGPHTVDAPDADLAGWLPANHAVFDGNAPTDAKFGYNLSAQPSLQLRWPPQPLGAASVIWDKGKELVGGTDVPLGSGGLVKLDQYGIWWLSDNLEDVPWPNIEFTAGVPETIEPAPGVRDERMRLQVALARTRYKVLDTVVTSLTAVEPLFVRHRDGQPSQTGDLEVGVDLSLTTETADSDVSGSSLLSVDGLKFRSGRAVGGLINNSPGLLIVQSDKPLVVQGQPTVHRGLVQISVASSTGNELLPSIDKLEDAVLRYNNGVPYNALPPSQISTISYVFQVPSVGVVDGDIPLHVHVTLLAGAAGTLPPLSYSLKQLPPAVEDEATGSGGLAIETWTETPAVAMGLNDLLLVKSGPYNTSKGRTLVLRLSRDGTADSYAGDVGVSRMSIILGAT